MAQKHVVLVFHKDVSPTKIYSIIDTFFKRLPTRICYRKHEKIDPDVIDRIAKTVGFCFRYPTVTFSFSETRDAVFAEEFIEEYIEKHRDARATIERITME